MLPGCLPMDSMRLSVCWLLAEMHGLTLCLTRDGRTILLSLQLVMIHRCASQCNVTPGALC